MLGVYVVHWTIWYHLYNLKNMKNTHGGVLILVKLLVKNTHAGVLILLLHGCFSGFLNCANGTKSCNIYSCLSHIYSCLSLFSISTEHPTNDQSFQNYQGEDEDPDASETFMIYIYMIYIYFIVRKFCGRKFRKSGLLWNFLDFAGI